jgi:ferric-dicitrate binding protein FerR (iron transport regulator)
MDHFPLQEIKDLIIRHLKKELSPTERDRLDQWIAGAPENAAVMKKLEDPEHVSALLVLLEKADPVKSWERFLPTIIAKTPETNIPLSHRLPWRRLSIAAASLLMFVTGVYFWKVVHEPRNVVAESVSKIPATILPGRNTAVLTLTGGQQVLLDSVGNGSIAALQDGHSIVKQDGKLRYANGLSQPNKDAAAPVAYNTLTTPRAGQFEIFLPDGTHVWLNNASSLRYPTAFTGTTRTVELTGEAYFDVARDASKPFQVSVNDLTVKVLGTGFNIMAYPDEDAVRTTLVQGKVVVKNKERESVLHPGEQVAASPTGDWKVLPSVNTEEITDWKNGLFHFDHADLPTVLRQLARWYNVEVVFKGPIPEKHIQGQMHRDLSLNQVLEILTEKDVHFSIIERKIIVTP